MMAAMGWRSMIIPKFPGKSSCSRRRDFYLSGDASTARTCSFSGISNESDEKEAAVLQKTALDVCDTIRHRPRWENSILSLIPPSSGIFHPNCIGLVIQCLSESNPLLSFRYFLWVSSTSSLLSIDPEASASFIGALASARAWKAAFHAIFSMKCFAVSPILNPFVLRICDDARSMHRDKNLLDDLCELIVKNCNSLSLASWNAALSASLRTGRTDTFYRLYAKMIESGTDPDAATAGYLIQALCRDGEPTEAYHVLINVSRKRIVPDAASITQLISYFSKAGNFNKVSSILHLMIAGGTPPDLFTYQEIIHALCDGAGGARMVDEAFRLFRDLKLKGYSCDVVTYTTMIDGLCKSRRMEEAWLLWSEMAAKGIPPNNYTYNAIIDAYCKAGDIHVARELYVEMLSKGFEESTISCNTMLYGFCFNGMLADAIHLFNQMPKRGIKHDVITYNTLIQGLCKGGRTSDAIVFYSSSITKGIQPSVSTYTPLIMSLCDEMRLRFATNLMKHMESQGLEPLVCMNDFVIDGFCRVGDADRGLAWLSKMLQSNLKPRAETMNGLVECLSSLGRVDDALQVVSMMFGISYSLGSEICHLLISRLCGEDSLRDGRVLDAVIAIS